MEDASVRGYYGILESYDVDEETAREDIQEFLDTLIEGGVLDDPAQQPDE